MRQPVLQDEAFLSDVRRAATEAQSNDGFRLWWLGQSGFLVQWSGRHLLIDPYLSDSLTRKYAATDRPHVRLAERVVAPEPLDFVDVVSASHGHTDHLDPETLAPVLRASPHAELVVPESLRASAAERADVPRERPLGLRAGDAVGAGGFTFTAVASAHELREQDEVGCDRYLGYVIAFGGWTLYHPGDTVDYDGLAEAVRAARRPGSPLVALLPINGRDPARGVSGNLDGPEAVRLARAIGADLVIPCHYGMFAFNTASPTLFATEAERLGQPFTILGESERWSSHALP